MPQGTTYQGWYPWRHPNVLRNRHPFWCRPQFCCLLLGWRGCRSALFRGCCGVLPVAVCWGRLLRRGRFLRSGSRRWILRCCLTAVDRLYLDSIGRGCTCFPFHQSRGCHGCWKLCIRRCCACRCGGKCTICLSSSWIRICCSDSGSSLLRCREFHGYLRCFD